jgi:hypothetical protein
MGVLKALSFAYQRPDALGAGAGAVVVVGGAVVVTVVVGPATVVVTV